MKKGKVASRSHSTQLPSLLAEPVDRDLVQKEARSRENWAAIATFIVYGAILLMVTYFLMEPLPTLAELRNEPITGRFARPVEVYLGARSLISQVLLSMAGGVAACLVTFGVTKVKDVVRSA